MLRKVRVESVNGINVIAGGNSLRCIGNKTVRVGDYVWTDGRCVYGFERTPTQPIVLTFKEEGIVILIIRGTLRFNTLWQAEAFQNVHEVIRLSYSGEEFFFTVGRSKDGKNCFALVKNTTVDIPEILIQALGAESIIVDATIVDGEIFSAYKIGGQWERRTLGYKGSQQIFDVTTALRQAYPTGVFSEDYIEWWDVRDVKTGILNSYIDIEGNFYCLAIVIYYADGTPSTDDDGAGAEWGNTYTMHWQLVLIKNTEYAVLFHYQEFVEVLNPYLYELEKNYNIVATTITSFIPHSVYLPVKNNGRGGYFSFDVTWDIREIIFRFKGAKFWDVDLNLLFSLTRADIVSAAKDSDMRTQLLYVTQTVPKFDFCQIASDDFILLIWQESPNSYFSDGFIFRLWQGKLSFLINTTRHFAVGTTEKKQAPHIYTRFKSKIEEDTEPIIV